MSRVGKYPVPVPAGVKLALDGRVLTATGKLGAMTLELTDAVDLDIRADEVAVMPRGSDRRSDRLTRRSARGRTPRGSGDHQPTGPVPCGPRPIGNRPVA